ncbi:MAG: MBL fold metallo-hydrolase [Kiritimatiellaeota bacterium]|nr:MBL fold metallo-hydrolase [Kiritimatiellota bacterium]
MKTIVSNARVKVNMENEPTFTIHGARGTMAVSGRAFSRYGGETTCFSLATRQGILIVDAGTGIIALGDQLMRQSDLPPITIMFTHLHLDHVIGLPLFKPLYRKGASITLMADPHRKENWPGCLRTLVAPPFWPLDLWHFGAAIRFQPLPRQNRRMRTYGVEIAWHPLRHPQQCLAYRLGIQKHSVVIATDNELDADTANGGFTDFCRGASVLIADAQYTTAEYFTKHGWGHGTWAACARLAATAGVGRLILTHHDRRRQDAQIDRLVRQAQRIFPATHAARSGMRVY